MRIADPHIHMVSRICSDYEQMALAGIDVVMEPSFWIGEPRKHLGTFLDTFDHLRGYERERAARYGILHFCALSMNPKESNNAPLAKEVLKKLPKYLDDPSVVAVGEIGFDENTKEEEKSFIRQLEIAAENKLPVVIHTPHKDKYKGTKRNLEILREMKYDMDFVLIDHNTEDTIEMALDSGAWCGHTVYPVTKLSPERAANIFEMYGVDRMMVNSSADWGPSDCLSVPRTIAELKRRGFSAKSIEKLVWNNPMAFFAQSGKLPEELAPKKTKKKKKRKGAKK